MLQNEAEAVEETASPQLCVLTKNDDWPVSVRRSACLAREEHLQLVGEQGVVKPLVEDVETVLNDPIPCSTLSPRRTEVLEECVLEHQVEMKRVRVPAFIVGRSLRKRGSSWVRSA